MNLPVHDDLAHAVSQGDIRQARSIFDKAFWENRKVEASWGHLKIALLNQDREMAQLLVTWGATATSAQISELSSSNVYAQSIALLRRCGVKIDAAAVQEATAAENPERTNVLCDWPDAVKSEELKPGMVMPDGSVFAGLTDDGKQQIFAAPADLGIMMTFNKAAKAVKELNADKFLGHGDWQIPSLENLRGLRKNQDEDSLRGTFKKKAASGSDFPDWYWSSTEHRGSPSCVHGVRFSDGREVWDHKDTDRLSCRPVRLVPCKAP